jgi:hypothetical protein
LLSHFARGQWSLILNGLEVIAIENSYGWADDAKYLRAEGCRRSMEK